MEIILSSEELMEYITNMNRENSVIQFFIPGKGRFTIVFQEEDQAPIAADVRRNSELRQMFNEHIPKIKQFRQQCLLHPFHQRTLPNEQKF